MEGEVTATYIQQLLAGMDVRVTRRARAPDGRGPRVRRRGHPGSRAGGATGRELMRSWHRSSRAVAVAAGPPAGSTAQRRAHLPHRRDLFSPRPLRRLAALGYLAGQDGGGTVRLLANRGRIHNKTALRDNVAIVLILIRPRLKNPS